MKVKKIILFWLLSLLFAGCVSSCEKKDDSPNTEQNTENNNPPTMNGKIKLTIGSKRFTATLTDNNSAKAFKQLLPLTLSMNELNGNEKYGILSSALPTNASSVGSIQTGDLMLYGNDCLVLFYKSFSSSYSYTIIVRIDDVTDLATTVGQGNISIKIETE